MEKKVYELYKTLLERYGPQGWWPADSPYEMAVGAILTQNTNWKNVEKAIANLKKANLLTPKAMLEAPLEKIKELIRPSGYYNQKAERLKLMTKAFLEANPDWDRRKLREHFLRVKGIGKETADSIVLYAFHKPIFVIDAYTRRFCKHFGLFEGKDYDEYREFFERNLPRDVDIFKEYHALIVRWGKDHPKSRRTSKG
ncbi:MAG: endonuclease III domain-containing protein [Candidatus Micrarchaeota archaeon]|nr:endonuclease III domain-containing protein [Candidatus Micrarchaeota archaeon]